MATGARLFDSAQVADIGNAAINIFELKKSISLIGAAFGAEPSR